MLNDPARVRLTGRVANAARLANIPGVVAPKTEAIAKDLLASPNGAGVLAARGFTFPVLLRSPGYHTGYNFERVDRPDDLARSPRAFRARRCWRSRTSTRAPRTERSESIA